MNYPKLKTRPRSTHTVFRFGGLWHSDEAPVGMTGGTVMRWQDLRNLGPDKYPMMSRVTTSNAAVELDGNIPKQPIIAAVVDGDHPVFLDTLGILLSNGHQLMTGQIRYTWEETHDQAVWLDSVYPVSGSSNTSYSAVYSFPWMQDDDAGPKTMKLRYNASQSRWEKSTGVQYTEITPSQVVHGDHTTTYVFAALGFEVVTTDDAVLTDWEMQVTCTARWIGTSLDGVQLIRMGAKVYILRKTPTGYTIDMWVDAVKLAAGQLMELGTDYGPMAAYARNASAPTLTMCDIDGNPFTGVTVSSSEPAHSGYWLDTSGEKSVLSEWSVYTNTWVTVSSTFVKINLGDTTGGVGHPFDALRKGDTVELTGMGFSTDPGQEVVDLLNSSHYLYGVTNDSIIVAGIIPNDTMTLAFDGGMNSGIIAIRQVPDLDYVVECGNRLWGCRYDEASEINEIYCSKLGDATNWDVFQGLSTDSWRASRGTPAPYTGAAVLDGHPLFFREESLEKVYPSSTGAHQIQTFTVDGVEKGSSKSLVIIDDKLYYKSRLGVCVYDGTLPRSISQAFGDLKFTNGNAGRHKKRYVICMTPSGGGAYVVGVYDTETGEWYLEETGWDIMAICWKDELYEITSGSRYIWQRYSGSASHGAWYAESGVIGYELPEHRYISCVQIRMRSQLAGIQTTVKVKIMYDDSGTWVEKGSYALPNTVGSREANIFPRRCDHFRIRIEGTGGADILSMSFRMERSEGGH